MSLACAGIPSNPDISGIGIRVNLYATTLLLAIIPSIPGLTTPLLNVLTANAGISGAALLITAIIETAKGQLTLYHAIFIVHVLFFLGVSMSPSGHYSHTRALVPRLILTVFLSYIMMLLYTAWALFIWSTARTFGSQPECNDQVKYIFFFKSVRATVKWIRGLWMAGLSISVVMLVVMPLIIGVCLCCMGRKRGWGGGGVQEEAQINWGLPLAAVYDVVMLELYVKRNRGLLPSNDDEQSWSFGQILALVMIMSTLNELFHFVLGLFWRSGGEEEDAESRVSQEDARQEVRKVKVRLLPRLTRWWRKEEEDRDVTRMDELDSK